MQPPESPDLRAIRGELPQLVAASGAEPVGSSPEQFGAYIAAEVAKWDRVVKQAKIPPVQ